MFYLIRESLESCDSARAISSGEKYVAVLTAQDWRAHGEEFDLGIDLEMEVLSPRETKAVVNMDSLTGSVHCPPLEADHREARGFAFALDEKGIILVDDTGYAEQLVQQIAATKKWKLPSLERFVYDLLEATIAGDLSILEAIEQRLSQIEDRILEGDVEDYPPALSEIRGDLMDLRVFYEQLIDLGQEFYENENEFFQEENLRYFHNFTERVIRLENTVSSHRDYVMQLRDLIQSQLDVKQNRIMKILTVVTTVFMPLTLIAGWYGMNFRYMPELEWRYGYLAVFIISVIIAVACLWWFKRKKWM